MSEKFVSIHQGHHVLCDYEIEELCQGENPMITPFTRRVEAPISYGLSSFGYDIRLGRDFKILHPADRSGKAIDPLDLDLNDWKEVSDSDGIVIAPGGFALGHSLETFHIPDDVITLCLGKSTYARVALVVNVTPFEPGWRGTATLELSNTSGRPLIVRAEMGIAQLLFFRGNRPNVTYGDRKGKYQDQSGVTPSRGG